MRELFEHEGHRAGDFFETLAAIQIEKTVWMELRASRTLDCAQDKRYRPSQ